MTTKTMLQRLLDQHGPGVLFSEQGLKLIDGAVTQLRQAARRGAATVRVPELRDRIPKHIRQDILAQSYILLEHVGRCTLIVAIFESKEEHLGEDPETYGTYFVHIYNEACKVQDSLRRLCNLTAQTYKPASGYLDNKRMTDVDF